MMRTASMSSKRTTVSRERCMKRMKGIDGLATLSDQRSPVVYIGYVPLVCILTMKPSKQPTQIIFARSTFGSKSHNNS
ncbi:hypothetical protein EVAR_28825_1 [Eumeta japonica]|uniref:Uncharacterized protein n=1 Tax=Eumeta variegata TaxID=151549 RepID=A0A4C1WHV8_EUMVA|nr:hypothetical protein EVAR_28825_1 [Eumeta japonica]